MIANLHIQASCYEGKTYLNKSYNTPPFKIADITEDKKAGILQLMLMSSSPGILDEDEYFLKIELDEYCNMQLHNQSYQRLFNMKKGAKQFTEIYLADNSSFAYLQHPAVPHEQSVFIATNNIYLGNHCNLIWGEVLTCGRKGNGEIFQFSKYHSSTSIFINKKIVVKENLLMQPSTINPFAIGQLEGYTHQASLILLDKKINTNELKNIVQDHLQAHEGISFGVSSAPVNGVIIRILGNKAGQLFQLLQSLANLVSVKIRSTTNMSRHAN
jgi:urease accessory protein